MTALHRSGMYDIVKAAYTKGQDTTGKIFFVQHGAQFDEPYFTLKPVSRKLCYLGLHPVQVLSRCRDSQLQVCIFFFFIPNFFCILVVVLKQLSTEIGTKYQFRQKYLTVRNALIISDVQNAL